MASLGEDLLGIVNKLQDLVFNTIGNDSLDLPQIVGLPLVRFLPWLQLTFPLGRGWVPIFWQILSPRKHSRQRFPTKRQRYCDSKTSHPPAHQHPNR